MLYASASTTLSKLTIGTADYVLTSSGTAPQYVAQSTLSVGSATNATNTAITANSTNADYYITVVSTNTGNLPQLVATGLTANPSTGKITSGVSGGTF
jgi:4-hydroxy-3-methylbut-2-enyl diphosphate reductase IspH